MSSLIGDYIDKSISSLKYVIGLPYRCIKSRRAINVTEMGKSHFLMIFIKMKELSGVILLH